MPVLLTQDGITQWLSADVIAPLHLGQAIPDEAVSYFPVSTEVNNARNHGPHLLDAVSLGTDLGVQDLPETLF